MPFKVVSGSENIKNSNNNITIKAKKNVSFEMWKAHFMTIWLAEHAVCFFVATGHGYMKIDETSLTMSAGVSEPS